MSEQVKKFLVVLLAVLGSQWFAPVVFIASTIATMEIVCYVHQCERGIAPGDSSPRMFQVMVRVPKKGDQVESVLLADLGRFIKNNPDSTLQLKIGNGVTNDESWEYSVVSDKAGSQIIEAHTIESGRIDVRYRASGQVVQPLALKVVSPGILFVSMPIAGAFTWVFLMLARRTRRKFQT